MRTEASRLVRPAGAAPVRLVTDADGAPSGSAGEVRCGGLTDLPQGRLGRFTGFRFTVDVNPQFALEFSVMSDQRSPSGPQPTPTERLNPYVIEHYGFAASSDERKHDLRDTSPSAAPPRDTNTL